MDWQGSGLKCPSVIKPIIFTVLKDDIIAKWGHIDPQTEKLLKQILPRIFPMTQA